MKRNKTCLRQGKPVRTLKQLRSQKLRLQHEIELKELEIRQDYHNLKETLSFRNLLTTLLENVLTANSVASGIFSLVSRWWKGRGPRSK
jgi:hypothetical protein